jgi:hypothetical protein
MRKASVTDSQILMLFELCLDAEDRCDERSRDMKARGDHIGAAREAELEQRYKSLRNKLFVVMKENPEPSLLAQLTQEVMNAGVAFRQSQTQADKPKPTESGS